MLKSLPPIRTIHWVIAALLALSLGASATAHAQSVTLPSTVSLFNPTTGYTYSYTVTDTTNTTLAIVTVPTAPGSALLNLIAPTGFGISYDSGNGLVSFFEDNNPNTPQTFAANSSVPGFSFTSFYGPGTVNFNALDVNANTYAGNTQAPTVAPEPSSIVLAVAGVALLAGTRLRRRSLTPSVSI